MTMEDNQSVRVVADSTADLGTELAGEIGVSVVSLTVTFGPDTYRDGVDLEPRAFFDKLAHSSYRPTTSQPTPGDFEEAFRAALASGGSGIVAILVSSRLSGTYASAERAVQSLRDSGVGAPIELVDSLQASLGMQFGVLAAARAARQGLETAAVAETARDTLARSSVFLVADDLGYLQRGGRIGQAQRFAGTLLNVKPIITLRDGVVVALESPRTRRRAYERLAERVHEMEPVESVIVGQSNQAYGEELEAIVRRVYRGPIRRTWAGATVGCHVGPGAAGLAVLRAAGAPAGAAAPA